MFRILFFLLAIIANIPCTTLYSMDSSFDLFNVAQLYTLLHNSNNIREHFVDIDVNKRNETTSDTLLHRYASYDQLVPIVKILFEKRPDVNARNKKGYSPLDCAVESGSREMVRLLIEYGADINAVRCGEGIRQSPLCRARQLSSTSHEYVYIVKLLEDKGAIAKIEGYQDELRIVVARFKIARLRELIQMGIPIDDTLNINFRGKKCTGTPLYFATKFVQLDFMKDLLEAGADSSIADNDGNTLLHNAFANQYYNNIAVAKLLIEYRACVNARNKQQETPLHYAYDARSAQLLLEAGAEINAIDAQGNTPLHRALACKRKDVFWELVKRNARVNISNKKLIRPLHYAYDGEIFQILLAAGAESNIASEDGGTVLHCAVAQGALDVVKMILDKKNIVDIDVQDRWGRTPLYLAAAIECRADIVKLLLEHNAKVTYDLMSFIKHALTVSSKQQDYKTVALLRQIYILLINPPMPVLESCED